MKCYKYQWSSKKMDGDNIKEKLSGSRDFEKRTNEGSLII